jgi:hypothetical protein
MKKIKLLFIWVLAINVISFSTVTAGQFAKAIKQTPATITGTLKYASLKYWIETGKNKTIDLSYDMEDSVLESQLSGLNGKKVTLSGTMTTYDDGSKYFEISKFSFGSVGSKAVAGTFTATNKVDQHAILFDGKIVYKNDECYLLSIKKVFSIQPEKVTLVEIDSGGTACPANYVFITAKSSGAILLSKEFGNCSDIPKIIAKGEKITLKFPGNPPETWTYQNGNVRKGM